MAPIRSKIGTRRGQSGCQRLIARDPSLGRKSPWSGSTVNSGSDVSWMLRARRDRSGYGRSRPAGCADRRRRRCSARVIGVRLEHRCCCAGAAVRCRRSWPDDDRVGRAGCRWRSCSSGSSGLFVSATLINAALLASLLASTLPFRVHGHGRVCASMSPGRGSDVGSSISRGRR